MLTQLIEKLSKCQNGNIQKPAKLFVYYEYIACILFVYCLYIVCVLRFKFNSVLLRFVQKKNPKNTDFLGFHI